MSPAIRRLSQVKSSPLLLSAFLVFASTFPLTAQTANSGLFTGPSILSRGTRPLGRSGGQPVRFRANLTFGTAYYGGLTRAGLEPNLQLGDEATYAGFLGFGLGGTRATSRGSTRGQYQGSLNLFGNRVTFTGVNQRGQISHSARVSRRVTAMVMGSGGTQSTVLNGSSPVPFDSDLFGNLADPFGEAFDTRMIQAMGATGLSYQKSARTTFSAFGGAGLQRRKAAALVDSNIYFAMGDFNHQKTRRTAFGANYMFMHVFHRRGYGQAYSQTMMGTFQHVLDSHWSVGLGGGAFRIETDRLQQVQVDPLIRAITGQASALEAFHKVFWGVAARASINGNYRTSVMSLSYDRGANPGNGFVLSGQLERVIGHYSYTGIRRSSVSAWATRMNYLPVLEALNVSGYRATTVGTSFAYRLTGFLHVTTSAQYLHSSSVLSSNVPTFSRNRYIFQAGLSFQPGEVPLLLW